MSTIALVLVAAEALAVGPDPHRQFDFWIGEWSVLNRHLQPDGRWLDGDVTRARITPVCGDRAVLEEWAGPFNGAFMNGFSLRAFDPDRDEWDLLLFWTTDGNGGFGRLRGTFRHGRGEFFSSWREPSGGEVRQRYTFSDALPETVRWDSAVSRDGGLAWKTSWIMEFSRTRAAEAVTQDRLLAIPWTEGRVSPHHDARRLDWLLGSWHGTQTEASSGARREARLRAKLLNKDCLVLDVLETRASATDAWNERLCVRGYVSRRSAWESWRVDQHDTTLRRSIGRPTESSAVFERRDAEGMMHRETLRRLGADRIVLEEQVGRDGDADLVTVRLTELERDP